MNYRNFKIEIEEKDLKKTNLIYKWLITMKDGKVATYVGISTRPLDERTKEHIRDKRTYFDKFLTENENNIKSIKIEVVKELKRNFKDMKTQLEKRETKLIIKDKLENAFNLNSKIDKRFA